MAAASTSSTLTVFQQMLSNVHVGAWKTGATIPSERSLIEEFGVSRIAIREALSMLRGLGVLEINHGQRTRVKPVDSATLGQILPLMLSHDVQQAFEHVFEVRLSIESQTAALAARRRTPDHLLRLENLLEDFRSAMSVDAVTTATRAQQIDLEFHLEIARASANPLFPTLLEALGGFVAFAQKESCRNHPARSQRAVLAHESILEAIRASDSDRARVEMEAHLRYSMTRKIQQSTSDKPAPEVAQD